MWVITREINEYDQDGEYFVSVYESRPSFQDLKALLPDEKDATLDKLTRGGGGQSTENEWYHLGQVMHGELYV